MECLRKNRRNRVQNRLEGTIGISQRIHVLKMDSKNRLCGWHLPPIEITKEMDKYSKSKWSQHDKMANKIPHKSKNVDAAAEQFKHFSNPASYIKEYRKTHAIGKGTMEYVDDKTKSETNDSANKHGPNISKYVDIR